MLCVLALILAAPAAAETVGRSAQGRPIELLHRGNPRAPLRVLVVGCIHGNECAGLAVTRLLERARPRDLDLWILRDLNPDGHAAGRRTNAHGVDLNRNFPTGWHAAPRGLEYPGPRPLSEPESRIARRLVLRLRPDVTIWYHQPQALVRAWGPSIPVARRYARLAGVHFGALRWPTGAATEWQNGLGLRAFVVEFPAGPLPAAAAARYADAVLRLRQ